MSVDIKSLRIGSHVLWNGKRRKVDAITKDSIAFRIADSERKEYDNATIEQIEPIAITPELLKELGFEWRKDSSCWRRYHNYDGVRYDWGIYAYDCDGGTWCFSLYLPDFRIKPQFYGNDLHEIEGQLAYYGVELIPD
ncbi:hypothetical protein [Muribaculum intestinale]|uniref:hypothetical protein n=1 Tax=Muribaculum intestinale TaxID=1796646 RepID=UPI0025B3D7ED|nr:hypothetical protein [Muribaculum intestinale]